MKLKLGCITDKGNYREKNQDRIVCAARQLGDEMLAVTCVCDGIGSFRYSEKAAEMMTEGIRAWFEGIVRFYPQIMTQTEVIEDLEMTIRELNEIICEYRKEQNEAIGCTMSLMLLMNSDYYIFHVGDSRICRVRDELYQLTTDEIVIKSVNGREKRLLANYIGKDMALAVCRAKGTVQPGDMYISGSDGLFKYLCYEDVISAVRATVADETTERACRLLIQCVLDRGEKDNISCSVMHL